MKRLKMVFFVGMVLLITSSAFAESKLIFSAQDPLGDDKGPGGYVYPTNKVFASGAFDLTGLEIYDEGDTYRFKVKMREPIKNPWNGSMGLSLQMIQIYLDCDQTANSGVSDFLPGVAAKADPQNAWEKVIVAEGWSSGFKDKLEKYHKELRKNVIVAGSELVPIDAAGAAEKNSFTIRVDKESVGTIDSKWAVQVLICPQQGMVDGVSNLDIGVIKAKKGEYNFGGAPNEQGAPNIIDLLDVPGKTQAEILSGYSTKDQRLAAVPFYPIGE